MRSSVCILYIYTHLYINPHSNPNLDFFFLLRIRPSGLFTFRISLWRCESYRQHAAHLGEASSSTGYHKHINADIPRVWFEPTIPVFDVSNMTDAPHRVDTDKGMVRSDMSKPALIFSSLQEYTQENPLSKF
jgi:hypothetical protein